MAEPAGFARRFPAGFARGFLADREPDAVEAMDSPDCDPARLERTYAQFGLVNAVVSGWRQNYRERIRPRLSAARTTTLLDVGCGGGDVARGLARWAAADGLRLDVTAIDPDPRAHAFAAACRPVPGVAYRRATSAELAAEGARFDIVVSNHVLHHLDAESLAGLLADSQLLCRGLALHADIARSRAGYWLFSAWALPFFPGSFIRRDGQASIRRSYTQAELAAVVPPPWQVVPGRPWRLSLVWDPAGRA